MRAPRSLFAVLTAAAVAVAGCGDKAPSASSGVGSLRVRLVDGPSVELRQVNLDIQRVEIGVGEEEGWRTLSTPNVIVDLLALRGGVSATLVSGATLPAGHYEQMRLVLGTRNSLRLADGTDAALTVPSGIQTGIKLNVEFDVDAGTTKDIFIDFDAHRSIQVHRTGSSAKYILRPTVRAYDQVVTGSITGRVADFGNGAGLGGAVVMAQTLDASGNVKLARTTVTDSSGAYTLDLLPVGSSYWVVTQPVVEAAVFEAAASNALALTADAPNGTWPFAVSKTVAVGSIEGTIASPESEHIEVFVLKSFKVDAGERPLIIRTAIASKVDEGATWHFDGLPADTYTVLLVRITVAADGSVLNTFSERALVSVAVGQVTRIKL